MAFSSMSENFGFVDLENLVFPAKMRVDYVRVYQPEGWQNSESRFCLKAVRSSDAR